MAGSRLETVGSIFSRCVPEPGWPRVAEGASPAGRGLSAAVCAGRGVPQGAVTEPGRPRCSLLLPNGWA